MIESASLGVVVALLSASTFAVEPPNTPPSVEFGPFPLSLLRISVVSNSGTPAAKAHLDGPEPDDYPPYTMVCFADTRKYPAFKSGPRYFSPGRNIITVYRVTQVDRAPYRTIQHDMARLKQLLKHRPKDVPLGDDEDSLPDYPPRNAMHLFHSKLSYWDAAWGSGLCYLTQFTQEADGFANNEELTYVFQGISKDGNFYLSAEFRITHPKLPPGIDARPNQRNPQSTDSAFLSKQPDDAFTPSLRKVREWVSSMVFE